VNIINYGNIVIEKQDKTIKLSTPYKISSSQYTTKRFMTFLYNNGRLGLIFRTCCDSSSQPLQTLNEQTFKSTGTNFFDELRCYSRK